jgi:hypothetical protein
MIRLVLALVLMAGAAHPVAAADDRTALARARQLYNSRDFDGAITAADEARHVSQLADSANLIAARSLLERYRANAADDDLAEARERLRTISPDRFTDRERLEYIVGLGETLYFDGAPGAAATMFDSVLRSNGPLLEGRDAILDWWASAVDEDARPRSEFERHALYQQVRTRMRDELGERPTSGIAAYWAVAAARGEGDLQGAWNAAEAAWVRAPLADDRGAALRGDLDRLVQRAIIPERARATGQSPEALHDEWESFKEKWNR